jgi:hypothetical protein
MTLRMKLWHIADGNLRQMHQTPLDYEERLEDWIVKEPRILGVDVLLIGRQVTTEFGGKIDLLGINSQGDLVVIELKRDRTPRQVVAQVLDYASWVKGLTYEEISNIAADYLDDSLAVAFSEQFSAPLPDNLNKNHSMIIVASYLDDASERIVQYLIDEYKVNINVAFFTFFGRDGEEYLGRAWLQDPEEVQEVSDSRTRGPWSGYWFVNVGEGEHRNWDDNRKYGYIGAGQGEWYSSALQRLSLGDEIFAYMKGLGYVGYGKVTREAVMIKDFVIEDGSPLLELPLRAPHADEHSEDPELSEWVVGIDWIETVPRDEAKSFKGIFANQNIVCKLRDQQTVEFLEREFGIEE